MNEKFGGKFLYITLASYFSSETYDSLSGDLSFMRTKACSTSSYACPSQFVSNVQFIKFWPTYAKPQGFQVKTQEMCRGLSLPGTE